MKKFTCCFFLLLCSFYCYSQSNQKLDSLKRVLARLPKEGSSFVADTMRVQVLCEMGENCENIKIDSAIKFVENALQISNNRLWQRGLMISNSWLGHLITKKGLPYKGAELLFRGLKYSEKTQNSYYKGFCLRYIGDAYSKLGDPKKSLEYHLQSLSFLKKHDKRRYLVCLNNIGLNYYGLKKYDEAIKYFLFCMKQNNGQNKEIISYCLTNLGASYKEKKQYDLAIYYFKLEQKNNIKDIDGKAFVEKEIASIYYLKNQYKKSESLLITILPLENQLKIETKKEIYELLYQNYLNLKNYQKAYFYYELFNKMNNIEVGEMQRRQLESLKYEYENEKQKTNILLLEKENEQKVFQRTVLIFGLFLVIIFGVFQYRNNNILINKNKKIEEQNSQIEDLNKNLEIKVEKRTKELSDANEELIKKNREIVEALFKGQSIERKRVAVELHDNLGGTLSAIKWRLEALNSNSLTEKEREIYISILEMMKTAYSEVRNISHNLLPSEFEKNGLLGAIQKLINDINQSKKIEISIVQKGNFELIENKVALELYSICLELLNNILKHSKATKAQIKLFNNNDSINIEVNDNGIGISENKLNGMGMQNMKNRLDSINGKISFSSDESGTKVNLKIYTLINASLG